MPKPVNPQRAPLRSELRIFLDGPRLLARLPKLLRNQPRGRAEPVLVLPGYATGDSSTWPLRRYLRALGYAPHPWGLGNNTGNVPDLVPRVIDRARGLAQSTGTRVRMVGWSLGGLIARETAHECPMAIDRVITLGSPVRGGPKYTALAPLYRRRGFDLDQIEQHIDERLAARAGQSTGVPVKALYSRRDGIVAWDACLDPDNPDVEHIEVDSTHGGMIFHSGVYEVIADELAKPGHPEPGVPTTRDCPT